MEIAFSFPVVIIMIQLAFLILSVGDVVEAIGRLTNVLKERLPKRTDGGDR